MAEALETIFESIPRVRILRICMRNSDGFLPLEWIVKHSGIRRSAVLKELKKLEHGGIIQKKKVTVREEIKSGNTRGPRKFRLKKTTGYAVDRGFELFPELHNLFTKALTGSKAKLLKKIKSLGGTIKLAVISGIFLNNEHCRTDLLLVGNGIKRRRLEKILGAIETELGKSISYTMMDTKEFHYRMDMYDRFLRDILEFPHEKIINRVGL